MRKTIVTINRHKIREDKKTRTVMPVRVSNGKYGRARYCYSFHKHSPKSVTVIYDPLNPLPCGATAWVEIEN